MGRSSRPTGSANDQRSRHDLGPGARATAGEIAFEGERIDGLAPPAIVRRGLIHVPEGRKIFPNLTVRENLELGSYARARPGRAKNLERAFDTFPRLRERAGQSAGTLSGGEQQISP